MHDIPFAVIFDMDGTLFQTNEILGSSLEKTFDVLRSMGHWQGEAPLAAYQKIMGVPLQVVWETLLPNHTEEIRSQTDKLFLECLNQEIKEGKGKLYPHVIETLSFFKQQGIPVFVASNGLEKYLEEIIAYYHLHEYVTDVYSVQRSLIGSKTDVVRLLLSEHNIKEAVLVGDRKSDIEAAKDNGLTAVGCTFGFATTNELADADFLINDFLELQALVSKRRSIIPF